eukprot:g2347.t1
MNYETWLLQRNDLRHAKSIAQARPAVSTRQASHMARKPDRKKIEQERLHIAAIDAENARLYGRLKKIHNRANDGWNKSQLFERLAPQFHKQHAQVRSLKLKDVAHRWSHDKRRLRGVTSFVKFKETHGKSLVPRRPDGIGLARKHRRKHRAVVESKATRDGGENADSLSPRDPFALTGDEAATLLHQRTIDPNIWKLEYRQGTKLDMASAVPQNGPAGRSSLCVVSCWSKRKRPDSSKTSSSYRLLVTVEDVRSSSKKMLLLRAEHLRHLMDDTIIASTNNDNNTADRVRPDSSMFGPNSECKDIETILAAPRMASGIDRTPFGESRHRMHRSRTVDPPSDLAADPTTGFSRHLVARANITEPKSVMFTHVLTLPVSRKSMKKQSRNDKLVPNINLVLTVSIHGAIVIRNNIGEILASDVANLIPGEEVVAADAMALKDALVALVTSRGRLLIHNFAVVKRRRIIAGRNDPMIWKSNEPTDKLIVLFRENEHVGEVDEEESGKNEGDEEDGLVKLESPSDRVTTVGLVPTRSTLNIIVLGTFTGKIYVLGGNMTAMFSSPQLGDGKYPVTALLTHTSSNIQAAAGNTIYFYSWFQRSSLEFRCVGPLGSTVVSMAQDQLDRHTLYAGTNKGELLIFDTRDSYRRGSDQDTCILRRKLVIADTFLSQFAPVTVKSTIGYIFVASASSISVHNDDGERKISRKIMILAYNTSGPPFSHPPLIMNHSYSMPSNVKLPPDWMPPFALSKLFNGRVAVRTTKNYLSLIVPLGQTNEGPPALEGIQCTEDEKSLMLGYETILPVEEPVDNMDITWIRGPLLGLSVVGVVLWQVYRRRRGAGGGAFSTGGNGFGMGRFGDRNHGAGAPKISSDLRAEIDRLSRTGPVGGFR